VKVTFHPHALARMDERGAARGEVIETVESGERLPAKHGRTGFRRNFQCRSVWRGREFHGKQVEAYAFPEADGWLVITVVVKYF